VLLTITHGTKPAKIGISAPSQGHSNTGQKECTSDTMGDIKEAKKEGSVAKRGSRGMNEKKYKKKREVPTV